MGNCRFGVQTSDLFRAEATDAGIVEVADLAFLRCREGEGVCCGESGNAGGGDNRGFVGGHCGDVGGAGLRGWRWIGGVVLGGWVDGDDGASKDGARRMWRWNGMYGW